MRIYIFSRHYPTPYKPYYDVQFAQLVEAGHDVTIFAAGHFESANDKIAKYELLRRTRYFPSTLRTVGIQLPHLLKSTLLEPSLAMRAAKAVAGHTRSTKDALTHWARAVTFGIHQPDLCLIHGLGTATMLPWLRRLFPDAKVALYYHGGEVPSMRPLEADQALRAFAAMDLVFTNTRFSLEQAVQRGCSPDHTVVLPVGFDVNDYTPPQRRHYRPGGILRLISVGRLSEEKGIQYGIEAVGRLVQRGFRNVRYDVVGDGYLRAQLEQFVSDRGLNNFIRFLGQRTAAEAISLMGEADALLLPSVQVGNSVETQACVLQEAMLMKTLVISSELGGVPESIPGEMRQFSVPAGDSAALSSTIELVGALADDEMCLLGEAARSFVLANYDIRRLNAKLLDCAREPG